MSSIMFTAVVATALSVLGIGARAAEDTVLSKEDKVCIECHAQPGFAKTLASGEQLSLSIPAKRFAESVHNSSGCDGCHSEIDLKDHGKTRRPSPASASTRWA
jgi:hypothetical protein